MVLLAPPGAHGYSLALRTMLRDAAVPAGYTLTTWGAGAVLLSAQGVPSLSECLSYVVGAALSLAALRAVEGAPHPAPARLPVDAVAAFHAVSAGGATAIAAGAAEAFDGPFAWALAAALATLAFFAISALMLSLGWRIGSRRSGAPTANGFVDAAG